MDSLKNFKSGTLLNLNNVIILSQTIRSNLLVYWGYFKLQLQIDFSYKFNLIIKLYLLYLISYTIIKYLILTFCRLKLQIKITFKY